MRPIKFRVWIYDNLNKTGKMYYGKDFAGTGNLLDYFEQRCDTKTDFLMQFTGLCDKNGTEIYEGDWVDVSMSFEGGTLPHRGVIVYDEEFGAFGTKNDAGITLLHFHCLHTLEVIGNIHQPELIEDKNG